MILGSHNSMTYLKPEKWWMKVFNFMSKCQEVSIEQQYDKYGIRVFDLRIAFDKSTPKFKHGLVTYKGDVEAVLSYLNTKKDVQVRLLLEKSTASEDRQEVRFIKACRDWERMFPNIEFFAGNRKHDWYKLYDFPDKENQINHMYSSMVGTKIDDLFPELYAKLNNKKNLKKEYDKPIFMYDFVNIK